jgi:phenylalanine-4-hydroxylase
MSSPTPPAPTIELVELDRDHPGFRDAAYRARRNAIAHIAQTHQVGERLRDVEYTAEEVGVWRTALEHLAPLHQAHAAAAFHARWPDLGFHPGAVPQFTQVNAVLSAATGFQLVPVAGLVTPAMFMSRLADGQFLATQYMRHHSRPLYTPEPDVIHELVGHAALLADPTFARLNRRFGEATRQASPAQIDALIRVYWYALEFGVAQRAGGGLEVIGAGLLSSFGELGKLATHARLLPFDIDRIAATPFDPTDYQATLFVAPSTAALIATVEGWLNSLIP